MENLQLKFGFDRCLAALSLLPARRAFSVGSPGNISAAVEDRLLTTPINFCQLSRPARIGKLDRAGNHVSGDKPSKEIYLHRAFYETLAQTGAVVHLHSTFASASSYSTDTDANDCIPSLRVGACGTGYLLK